MAITRSSRRPTEVLQVLEAPTRSRRRPARTALAVNPRSHTPSPERKPSPKPVPKEPSPPPKSTYCDALTQTEEVIIIIPGAETPPDVTPPRTTQKRARSDEDGEDSDEPRSRKMAKTPDHNPFWMFQQSYMDRTGPRTAPVNRVSALSLTPRRQRGPLSKSQRPLPRNSARATRPASIPSSLSPVKVDRTHTQPVAPTTVAQQHDSSDQQDITSQPAQQPATAQPQATPSRIFGSIRGIAQTGWNLARMLSPQRTGTQQNSQTAPAAPQAQTEQEHQVEGIEQDTLSQGDSEEVELRGEVQHQSQPQTSRPSRPTAEIQPGYTRPPDPRYDHFHFLKVGSAEADHAFATGAVEWPEPKVYDRFADMKAHNPMIPDAQLKAIIARKERREKLQEEITGIPANPPPPVCAPLFGPDSHEARGTIDPRQFRRIEKRKHQQVENSINTGSNGGLDSSYAQRDTIALENEAESFEDDPFVDTPTAKRQRTMFPETPRSAMKKPADFGSVGRSSRSVLFKPDPVSGIRDLRAHYGPAGQYRGSTFADKSPPSRNTDSSMSSFDYSDVISPATLSNTAQNTASRMEAMAELEKNIGANIPEIDFTLRDPNDPNWRPTISNPRPGSFRVPDLEDEDEDMEGQQEGSAAQTSQDADSTPAQPSTPRMSHAKLPNTTPAFNISYGSNFNPDSVTSECTDLALEKARSQAQKYKPKDSSRLSEVSQAISRSPSPESEDDTLRPFRSTTEPAVRPSDAPLQPFAPHVPRTLDNTIAGADGMTDYEREHQFDAWAASLAWDGSQTYEEAGTGTPYIHNLIRKNWTEEDSRHSESFWGEEFERIDRLQEAAKSKGQRLQFRTAADEEMMEEEL